MDISATSGIINLVWPLLCSGPADSHFCVRRGFFVFFPSVCSVSGDFPMRVIWRIDSHVARIATDRFSAELDLRRPFDGLTELTFDGHRLPECAILGVQPDCLSPLPAAVTGQAYVRGADLVATYPASDNQPLRWQIYWRLIGSSPDDDAVVLEAIVSVQTDLLDTSPSVSVTSELAGGRAECLAAEEKNPLAAGVAVDTPTETATFCGVICDRVADRLCYLEMIEPADRVSQEITEETTEQQTVNYITSRLFDGHLEKGVIRRTRVRGVFLPQRPDEALLGRLWSEFALSAAPLST